LRIIAVVGRVLDPQGIAVNRRVERIFVNREEYIAEPADRCALEVALQVKDLIDAELIVLPRGMLPDADVLRMAVAAGADSAVHVVRASMETEGLDDAASARLLAAAIEWVGGADLVLTGARTLETGQGQLGPRLAEALGWPQELEVRDISVSDGRFWAVIPGSRRLNEPTLEYARVELPLPCVVTVPAGALKPRYPDGVRLINVFRGTGEGAAALKTVDVSDLMDPEALTPVWERRGQKFPPIRERGIRIGGSHREMAVAAADALRKRLPV
jgi:electron transfer flavoprotein beta subunit